MLYVMDLSSLLTVQSGTEKYIFERLFSEHILKYNVEPTFRRSILHIILDTRSNIYYEWVTCDSENMTQQLNLYPFKRPLYPTKSSASEWTTFHLFFGWSKSLFQRFETSKSKSYHMTHMSSLEVNMTHIIWII